MNFIVMNNPLVDDKNSREKNKPRIKNGVFFFLYAATHAIKYIKKEIIEKKVQ